MSITIHQLVATSSQHSSAHCRLLPLRERERYRIGMEWGIKGGDNKHLICSLRSFGSAVCRWVNKARSVQCRHVIHWPSWPCGHAGNSDRCQWDSRTHSLGLSYQWQGDGGKSMHSLARINQQNLDQHATVLNVLTIFSSASKSLKHDYHPTFIKAPQQPLAANPVNSRSSTRACKNQVNPAKPPAESTYDQLWQED